MLDLFVNALAAVGVMAFLFVIAVTVAAYKLAKSGKLPALEKFFGQADPKPDGQHPNGQ